MKLPAITPIQAAIGSDITPEGVQSSTPLSQGFAQLFAGQLAQKIPHAALSSAATLTPKSPLPAQIEVTTLADTDSPLLLLETKHGVLPLSQQTVDHTTTEQQAEDDEETPGLQALFALLSPAVMPQVTATAMPARAQLEKTDTTQTLASRLRASTILDGNGITEEVGDETADKSISVANREPTVTKLLRNTGDAAISTNAPMPPNSAQLPGEQSDVSLPTTLLAPTSQTTLAFTPQQIGCISNANHSAPAVALSSQLGSAEWQQELGQQLQLFTRHGQQSAELRLHPQELGALQISLKVEDQQAQLHLVSANGQVRAALEAALPALRNALAESGIQLGQSSVGSDTPAEWQAPQQEERHQRDGDHNEPDAIPVFAPSLQRQQVAAASGGVDIFA